MRRALPLLMLLTLLPAAAWSQALSPGPLARDHAQLDDDDQCGKCHQPGAGVVNALCLDCHRVLAERVRAGTGYHGRALKGRPCAECHKDHLGRDAALTRWPGGRPENFPHGRTGFHLIGAHQDAGCRDCHTAARIADADARALEGTYLGLPTTCVGCHGAEDPHQGTLRDQPCSGCHGQEAWRPAAGFDHAKTEFPLRGKHAEVECGECHEGTVFAQSKRTCEACHSNPHPKATGFAPTCATCHAPDGWARITWPRAQHRSFPLTFGHDVADCGRCHGDDGNRAPTPACGGCHEDPHRGSLGNRCQRCHDTQDWRRVRRDAVDHDRFAFELRGRHTDVACEACHPNGKLKPIPHAQCLDCHRDPHGGEVGTT
ncbi:MAG: cytochrome c3 family protein, partial [Myxococcales bacterium]|nr:cytochrome c3 family protein [Myxococcales bacterium]